MMFSLNYRHFLEGLIFLMMAFPHISRSQSLPMEEIRKIETSIRNINTLDKDGTVAIDGILADKSRWNIWFQADHRVMFILKEPYDAARQIKEKAVYYNEWLSNGYYNTIRDIPQEDGGQTYRPIATITNMIVKDSDYYSVRNEYDSPDAYKTFLEHTAIINCKKEHNRNSVYTAENELIHHISKYSDILEEQIRVYNPTVVIFANTYKYLIKNGEGGISILGDDIPAANIYTMQDGMHKYYFNEKRVFIEAYHPSAHVNKEIYCTQILEAVHKWEEETQSR